MKKIIILCLLTLFSTNMYVYAACSIDSLGICQSGISRQDFGNTNIQDRLIPNRINNMQQPNSLMEDRTMQGQTQSPPQINRELLQQESTQPYNSNCQFGNCVNRTNSGILQNNN